ncbi:beta-lactamase/transpeptidase-like protein [Lasiosphaeria miniovina]|uniref:Beta-lactamase/transpeptidase-like protein n=1 Tax=Lasiosphaeria miniovina TaxID=1954250 RepID=A0AA40EDR0_9PEZI|nr:beta-lactamase/transpeptidase-like protein [Lasiosphaeria miniovina]KAK0734617.1 beta-lactamase/transpeptidase-like protein [Lasiosphaeria miniovina]
MHMIHSLLLCLTAFLLAAQAQVNPWEARHGLTAAAYQQEFNDLTSKGYRLNWLSGYALDDVPHFAAIFEKKSSPAWVARHGLTAQQYQDAFTQYVSQGFNLVLVNGYNVAGVDYYAAIWDKAATGAWLARHGMTAADYQSAFDTNSKAGYRLVHVSGYSVKNDARYAAIWRKTNDNIPWVARHGMTGSDYQSAFNTYANQGYRLVLVNGYQVGGTDYYVAIWDKAPGAAPWVARHGLTSSQFQAEFDNNLYQGYVPTVVSGYNQAGHYAAVWENRAMKGSDLSKLDAGIGAYMAKYKVPGLSLAVTQNDRLVFAKGYGFADTASGTIATPNSRFRIMSISKSITATAVMKLRDAGKFKLTDKVFGPGSVTGDTYADKMPLVNNKRQYPAGLTDIRVQDLLEHQAGFGPEHDPEGALKTLTPAQAVSKILAAVPLNYTVGTQWAYSNFGFLVLGRLVADLGGAGDYETYVRSQILAPAGAAGMQLASNAGALPGEASYYPAGASGSFRIHEFDSFGGWVATMPDLARWYTRFDGLPGRPDALDAATETEMWTPGSKSGGGYAKGWIVNGGAAGGAPGGWRGHNGAFGGTSSFFSQRTDGTGLGFAVVMNINSGNLQVGDGFSFELRGVVDGIIGGVAWPAYDLF